MLTAVTGGIGSGKSVVSRVLAAMGFRVYDCDREAKRLMDHYARIKDSLCREIHPDCVDADGRINRSRLSEIVFADRTALDRLNSIVHSAVRADLRAWCEKYGHDRKRLFVETAILYQSGLDAMVDDVWVVEAPTALRVERVMARNSLSREQVLARIEAQDSYVPASCHQCVSHVVNDGCFPVLPQIERLL